MQPHDVAIEYLGNADILLSIGNAESPMAPSKIYEYMSTGKPIIHVYTYEKDPCIEPLKKYGNALLLNDEASDMYKKILSFVTEAKELQFERVRELFKTATPEYTVNLIEKA